MWIKLMMIIKIVWCACNKMKFWIGHFIYLHWILPHGIIEWAKLTFAMNLMIVRLFIIVHLLLWHLLCSDLMSILRVLLIKCAIELGWTPWRYPNILLKTISASYFVWMRCSSRMILLVWRLIILHFLIKSERHVWFI